MKRIILSVFLLVSAVFLAYGFSRQVSSRDSKMRVSIKDYPSHGIVAINPSEPAFDERMAAITSGDEDLRQLVEAAKPFSLFIRNESGKDIVGCSLTWEFLKADGSVESMGTTYSTPGVLMGTEPKDPSLAGKISLIPAGSVAFFSLDPLVKQYVDVGLNNRGGISSLNQQSRQIIKNHAYKLRGQYEKLAKSVVHVTASVDGAIYDDGLFMGPDVNKFFTYLDARINAKRDFALSVERDLKSKKKPAEILRRVEEEIAKKPRAENAAGNSREEYYAKIYEESTHIYAEELLRVGKARGDDSAVEGTQNPLRKAWPKLRKES